MIKYLCGKNSVLDAINNKIPIKKLYLAFGNTLATPSNIEVEFVSKEYLNALTKQKHQGFVAEINEIKIYDLNIIFKNKPEKVLILDHLQDPYNFGAIIRSANAFGFKFIIFPKERAVDITETVLKVSSGGFIDIKFIKVGSIVNAIEKLKKNNFWIYGSDLSNQATKIDATNFNSPLAIVIGSEGKGISKSVIKVLDQTFYIPMEGTVQSLNASVATGITLFHVNKKIKF
ncbi:23S rRNA (guanosine(2251)-2'-O)-methyltransferase RlmB [Candidatus Mycoplasma pogonae]